MGDYQRQEIQRFLNPHLIDTSKALQQEFQDARGEGNGLVSGLGEETFLPHQSLQSLGSGLIDRNSVTCMSLRQPPWARAWSSLTGLGRGLLTSMKTGGVHTTLTSWTSGRIRSARWASQTDENYRRKCPSLPPGEKGAVRPGALGQVIFPWDSLKKKKKTRSSVGRAALTTRQLARRSLRQAAPYPTAVARWAAHTDGDANPPGRAPACPPWPGRQLVREQSSRTQRLC